MYAPSSTNPSPSPLPSPSPALSPSPIASPNIANSNSTNSDLASSDNTTAPPTPLLSSSAPVIPLLSASHDSYLPHALLNQNHNTNAVKPLKTHTFLCAKSYQPLGESDLPALPAKHLFSYTPQSQVCLL